ncbi:MAG: hypothetical protein CMD12_07600 [Flavobacteriales bacterium]|nr:hypothetical protein [Flavobacteriales bacterium]
MTKSSKTITNGEKINGSNLFSKYVLRFIIYKYFNSIYHYELKKCILVDQINKNIAFIFRILSHCVLIQVFEAYLKKIFLNCMYKY